MPGKTNIRMKMFTAALMAGALGMPTYASGPEQSEMLPPPPNDRPTAYNLTYGAPFIDIDEMRTEPRPHRYIHGGFEDSHLRFSVYLPPEDLYQRRYLLMLEGGQGGLDKMMTGPRWKWAFDVAFDDLGAYLIETNEGHWPDEGLGVSTAEELWGASGYAVSYARTIADTVLGSRPQNGYLYGCSGGGVRSAEHLENLPDLFSGGVPQAWGMISAQHWSSYALAGALIGDKLDDVRDALEVGGSGDPYKGLNPQQAEALREFLGLGYPRDGLIQLGKEGWPAAPFIMYTIRDTDPEYFADFWSKPGYVGHDHPEQVQDLLLDTTATVEQVLTVRELRAKEGQASAPGRETATYGAADTDILESRQGVVLKLDVPAEKLNQAVITLQSGADKGKTLQIVGVGEDGILRVFIPRAAYGFNNVAVGDTVKVSNRDYIAYMYFYRHTGQAVTKALEIGTPGYEQAFPEFRVLMNPDGTSKYVQRQFESRGAPGKGPFTGKVIMLSGSADEPIWPTAMTPYRTRTLNHLGDKAADQYRVWWVDNHPHCGAPSTGPGSTSLVPATGLIQQALKDVVKWAEDGIAPAADTAYRFSDENALILPPTAAERKGIQPVVQMTVNGGARADVAVGVPVTFSASAETPPGAGSIVNAAFDFDGQGLWREEVRLDGSPPEVRTSVTYSFSKPGTYYPAFRAGSRVSDTGAGEPIWNLARVRVVVK